MLHEILNNPFYVGWIMIAFHIIVDFLCQGNLAQMKQKRWWKKEMQNYADELNTVLDNAINRTLLRCAGNVMDDLAKIPDKDKVKHIRDKYEEIRTGCSERLAKMYKYDYLVALVLHSHLWSIVVFAPLFLRVSPASWTIIVMVNAVVHAVIDHVKCNKFGLNLIGDQSLHLFQMAVTFCIAFKFW